MKTPSQALAEIIISRLTEEKILTEQQAKPLLPKLSEGKVSQEDWNLAIEMSIAERGDS